MNYRMRKGEGREERGGSVVAQEKMWCADLLEALVVDKACGIVGHFQLPLCDGFSELPVAMLSLFSLSSDSGASTPPRRGRGWGNARARVREGVRWGGKNPTCRLENCQGGRVGVAAVVNYQVK